MMAENKKVKELHELNEHSFEYLFSWWTTKVRKVVFHVIKSCKTNEYPDGFDHVEWEHLVKIYAPRSATLLFVLRKQFENSHIKSMTVDPEAWIIKLEDMPNQIDENGLMT